MIPHDGRIKRSGDEDDIDLAKHPSLMRFDHSLFQPPTLQGSKSKVELTHVIDQGSPVVNGRGGVESEKVHGDHDVGFKVESANEGIETSPLS
jgi:hypothetical protein